MRSTVYKDYINLKHYRACRLVCQWELEDWGGIIGLTNRDMAGARRQRRLTAVDSAPATGHSLASFPSFRPIATRYFFPLAAWGDSGYSLSSSESFS